MIIKNSAEIFSSIKHSNCIISPPVRFMLYAMHEMQPRHHIHASLYININAKRHNNSSTHVSSTIVNQ